MCVIHLLEFNINFKDKNFSILTEIPKNNPDSMDIDFLMNIPTIKITLNNKSINAFLDTGAKISYINKKYTQDLKSIDSIEDFYPTIGTFRTDIYKMSITFNYSEINLTFGVLPEMLEAGLLLGNVEGIIGNDIFQYYSLTFDYENKKIYCKNT